MGICLKQEVGLLLSLVRLARLDGGSTGWGSGEGQDSEDLEGTSATGLCSQESLGGREEMTARCRAVRDSSWRAWCQSCNIFPLSVNRRLTMCLILSGHLFLCVKNSNYGLAAHVTVCYVCKGFSLIIFISSAVLSCSNCSTNFNEQIGSIFLQGLISVLYLERRHNNTIIC